MVAMILLIIIALSSAYFFAIPPFRKEAIRFAALERAAGVMDFVCAIKKLHATMISGSGYYELNDFPVSGKPSLLNNNPSASIVTNYFYLPDHDGTNRMPLVWYTFKVSDTLLPTPSAQVVQVAEMGLYDKPGATNSLFATLKLLLPPSGP